MLIKEDFRIKKTKYDMYYPQRRWLGLFWITLNKEEEDFMPFMDWLCCDSNKQSFDRIGRANDCISKYIKRKNDEEVNKQKMKEKEVKLYYYDGEED